MERCSKTKKRGGGRGDSSRMSETASNRRQGVAIAALSHDLLCVLPLSRRIPLWRASVSVWTSAKVLAPDEFVLQGGVCILALDDRRARFGSKRDRHLRLCVFHCTSSKQGASLSRLRTSFTAQLEKFRWDEEKEA